MNEDEHPPLDWSAPRRLARLTWAWARYAADWVDRNPGRTLAYGLLLVMLDQLAMHRRITRLEDR